MAAKKKRRMKCSGCKFVGGSPTQLSRHWDEHPDHLSDKQKRSRATNARLRGKAEPNDLGEVWTDPGNGRHYTIMPHDPKGRFQCVEEGCSYRCMQAINLRAHRATTGHRDAQGNTVGATAVTGMPTTRQAAPAASRRTGKWHYCPQCGSGVIPKAKFCVGCGQSLA